MSESDIIFERTVLNEEAIVIRDGLNNLSHPKLVELLTKVNFPPELFSKLITLQHEWTKGPVQEEYPPNGIKTEDILFREANTSNGPIEVSDVCLYKTAVPATGPDISFHLKQPNVRGFEAILVLNGEATLFFPDSVEPVTLGAQMRSDTGQAIRLHPGDLVFIPASAPNGWSDVGDGFQFRYIGQPPWHPQLIENTY